MNNQFQSTSIRYSMEFQDLIKIAVKNKLTVNEQNLFVDMITDLFPDATKSYADHWATRIKRKVEYCYASGNTRSWLDRNPFYDRVKEERGVNIYA